MPLISAINGDTRNIQAGCPVVGKFNRLQFDRVILAGGTILAAGIVTSGSSPNGIVNLQTDGIVNLPDWSLSTGAKYLKQGATYRLSQNGKLSTGSTGQLIGLAISATQLSLQITDPSSTSGSGSTVELQNEITARIAGDTQLAGLLSTETANRAVSESALQLQITELQQPTYARILLLGA